MDITLIVGASGLIVLLLAYFLLSTDVIDEHMVSYQLANVVGSLALGYYAFVLGAWVFVILEIVWALFAFVEVCMILCSSRKTKRHRR